MPSTSDPDLAARIRELYERVDAGDEAVFDDRFAAHGRLVINGAEVAVGPAAIKEFMGELAGSFASARHDLVQVSTDPAAGVAVAEMTVNNTLRDGGDVRLHECGIAEFHGDLIVAWRVYVDVTALAA